MLIFQTETQRKKSWSGLKWYRNEIKKTGRGKCCITNSKLYADDFLNATYVCYTENSEIKMVNKK